MGTIPDTLGMDIPVTPLARPPIVEAILDLECDLPADFSLEAIRDTAGESLKASYPDQRDFLFKLFEIEAKVEDSEPLQAKNRLEALRFFNTDGTGLVQFRQSGYSFNRIGSYSSLDQYLAEIKRTWELFQDFAAPNFVRQVRLRFINKIDVPIPPSGIIGLGEYFHHPPGIPMENRLVMHGFLSQSVSVDKDTQAEVKITLTDKKESHDRLTVVLDIETYSPANTSYESWDSIQEQILQLRQLKNQVFFGMITDKCGEMFK